VIEFRLRFPAASWSPEMQSFILGLVQSLPPPTLVKPREGPSRHPSAYAHAVRWIVPIMFPIFAQGVIEWTASRKSDLMYSCRVAGVSNVVLR
jgi:hypothetical protein